MFLGFFLTLMYLLFFLSVKRSTMAFSVLVILSMMMVGFANSEYELLGFFWFDFVSTTLVCLTVFIFTLMFLESFLTARKVNLCSILLILCGFLLGSFLVSNFFFFFFLFESSLIPVLLLIAMWGVQPERLQACSYMVLYTSMGAFPFLFAISSMAYNGLSDSMQSIFGLINRSECEFFWFYLLGFFIKLPMFPFHLWLPKAHVEAPVVGSMVLAGILLKLGGYGLIRFLQVIIIDMSSVAYFLIISVSLIGGVLTSFMCLRQVDLKSLIAYSSVGHMSLVLVGVLSYTFVGMMGSVIMMLGHGLCSSGLFLLVNLFYKQSNSRSIILNKGYLMGYPFLALFCFLLSIGNMSAPPSMNFFGEVLMFLAGVKMSVWVVLMLVMMSFMSACYSLFFYSTCCHGKMNELTMGVVYFRDYLNLAMHWLPFNLLFLFL